MRGFFDQTHACVEFYIVCMKFADAEIQKEGEREREKK